MPNIINIFSKKIDDFKFHSLWLLMCIIEFFDNQYDKIKNKKRDRWYDQ